jgi:hypothetical protein
MELVALLRVLWRHRLAVAVGGVVALAIGLALTRGAVSRIGVASVRIVLDTPQSQLLNANPVGMATLEWRADLLADAGASDDVRGRVAGAMGIPAQSLVITAPSRLIPTIPVSLPAHALDAAAASPVRYQLAIQAASGLPIVGIDARAPTRAEAARLATEAVRALQARAKEDRPTNDTQDFSVEPVGAVNGREIVDKPRKVMAAAGVVVVFGLWCTAVTFVAGVARARGRRRGRGGGAQAAAWS